MANGNSVWDEIKEQHKKLEGASFREKLSYFLYYYKVHVLVFAALVVFACMMIHDIVTQKDNGLYVIMANSYPTEDIDTIYAGEYADFVALDTNEYQVTMETGFSLANDAADQYTFANIQKFMAIVASADLDGFVADRETYELYCDQSMFYDLREVLPADLLEKYKDKLFYYDPPEDPEDAAEDQGAIPLGIRVDDSEKLTTEEYFSYMPATEPIYGIICNSNRIDAAIAFLEYLEGEEAPTVVTPEEQSVASEK